MNLYLISHFTDWWRCDVLDAVAWLRFSRYGHLWVTGLQVFIIILDQLNFDVIWCWREIASQLIVFNFRDISDHLTKIRHQNRRMRIASIPNSHVVWRQFLQKICTRRWILFRRLDGARSGCCQAYGNGSVIKPWYPKQVAMENHHIQ